MAQLPSYSRMAPSAAPDLFSRIEWALYWITSHWYYGLAAMLALLLAIGGWHWQTNRQRAEAQRTSVLYTTAIESTPINRAALENLLAGHPRAVTAQLARFDLARLAFDDQLPEHARELLHPLANDSQAIPLFRSSAASWIGYSYEAQNDWTNAAQWFQTALDDPNGVDRATLLATTVRALTRAGQVDAARALVSDDHNTAAQTTATHDELTQAKAVERLWLNLAATPAQ